MECLTLRGEMAKRRVTLVSMSKLLGIHRNSLAHKLNGVAPFTIEESLMIQEHFFPDLELKYLFKKGA